jgi:hypothetical protein
MLRLAPSLLSMAQPGVDFSKAKSHIAPSAVPLIFIFHFTEEGKIDRIREYWDAATTTRPIDIESAKSKILAFLIRRASEGA